MVQTFEDFLKYKHAKQFNGRDDDMPQAYDSWFNSLDNVDLLGFAQEWGDALIMVKKGGPKIIRL